MKRRTKRKKKKPILITTIIIILLIISIIGILLYMKSYKESNTLKVTLVENLDVEINSETNLLSFIKSIKSGEILTEDSKIDTSKLGKKDLEILIKNAFDEEIKYTFKVNVIDTTKPIIENKEEITTYKGKKIDLLESVNVTDNSLEEISIDISGTYDINTVGEYELSYIAKDSSGNETTSNFVLKVISDPNNYTFKTSKGYTAKVITGSI